MKRTLAVSLAFVLCLMSIGCAKNVTPGTPAPTLQQICTKVDNVLGGIANGVIAAQTDIKTFYPDPANADRVTLLAITVKFAQYLDSARTAVQQISTANFSTPANILSAIKPILAQARTDLDNGLLGIKNPDSKTKATTWINGIEIALDGALASLEVILGSQ